MGRKGTYKCFKCDFEIESNDLTFYLTTMDSPIEEMGLMFSTANYFEKSIINGFVDIAYCGCGHIHKNYRIYGIKPPLTEEEALEIVSKKIKPTRKISELLDDNETYDIYSSVGVSGSVTMREFIDEPIFCPECNSEMITEEDLEGEIKCPSCGKGRMLCTNSVMYD